MKKGKSGSKFMILLIAGIVVFLLAMTLLSNAMGKKEIVPNVAAVKSVKGNITEKLDTSGTVESQNKKTFFSPVNAKIKTVGMEAGDSVKSGQKLITFDLEDLETQNKKAELNIRSGNLDIQDAIQSADKAVNKQAEAAAKVGPLQAQVDAQEEYVAQLKSKISEATINAQEKAKKSAEAAAKKAAQEAKEQQEALEKNYKEELKKYETETLPNYNKKLADHLAEVTDKTAKYNSADTKYQQAFQIWSSDQNADTEKALNDADKERSDAQNLLRDAEEKYNEVQNNPPEVPVMPEYSATAGGSVSSQTDASAGVADTTDLQNELERASTDLAELQAELSQQKSIAESDVSGLSDAALEKMNISSNLSELEAKSIEELIAEGKKGVMAEFNGVISSCNAVEGAVVSQGMELFTLQSTENVNVKISVAKSDYTKIKEGQKAVITMGDNQYNGKVAKVNKIAEPNEKGTPMIGAEVHIENPDENIFIGVEAKVSIESANVADALMVPVEAVNIGNSGSFCYAVENGVIVKKPVVTGISSKDYTEIKEGLSEGEDILTDIGSYAEGDKVNPAPETAASESAAK